MHTTLILSTGFEAFSISADNGSNKFALNQALLRMLNGIQTRTIFSPSSGDSNSWLHCEYVRSFEEKRVIIIIISNAVACQSAPLSGMTFSLISSLL